MVNKEELLSLDELYRELDYDKETGIFTWKYSRPGVSKGKKAGGHKQDGSISISIKGKEYYAHRLAWYYMYKEWPNGIIDHINRNNSDNSISNLRVSNTTDNGRNRKDHSQYGHNITRKDNGFAIQIQLNGVRYRYKLDNINLTIRLRDWLINTSKTSKVLPMGTYNALQGMLENENMCNR